MVGTTSQVLYAGLVFIAIHIVPSTPLRQDLIRRLGEGTYRGLFSLISALALGWLIWAYGQAPAEPLWTPPSWALLLPWIAMPISLILLVGGLMTRNPMAVGQEAADTGAAARGMMTITRHPIMWAIAIWAVSHLPASGDRASLYFFGVLAFLSLAGMVLIDRRKQEAADSRLGPFMLTTSTIPFVAAIQKRTSIDWAGIGAGKIVLALVIYAALIAGHEWIVGVPLVGLG